MRWRGKTIAMCATVAVLAATVAAADGAAAADRASPGIPVSTAGGVASTTGASAAYRSSVTITLDRPAGVVEKLPVGATEEDVLEALGEPRERRTPDADSEEWDYGRYVDQQRYAFILTTLTFRSGRLADIRQYDFR